MYTNTSNSPPRIDSLTAREGSFQMSPDGEASIEVRLAYVHKESGEGWGFFDARTSMLSPKTIEAFRNFIMSVEEDVGQQLFSEGAFVLPVSAGPEILTEGLNFKGLGEK